LRTVDREVFMPSTDARRVFQGCWNESYWVGVLERSVPQTPSCRDRPVTDAVVEI